MIVQTKSAPPVPLVQTELTPLIPCSSQSVLENKLSAWRLVRVDSCPKPWHNWARVCGGSAFGIDAVNKYNSFDCMKLHHLNRKRLLAFN